HSRPVSHENAVKLLFKIVLSTIASDSCQRIVSQSGPELLVLVEADTFLGKVGRIQSDQNLRIVRPAQLICLNGRSDYLDTSRTSLMNFVRHSCSISRRLDEDPSKTVQRRDVRHVSGDRHRGAGQRSDPLGIVYTRYGQRPLTPELGLNSRPDF